MLNQLGFDFEEQVDFGVSPEFLDEMMEMMEAVNDDDLSQDRLRLFEKQLEVDTLEIEKKLNDLFQSNDIPEAIKLTCKLNYFQRIKSMIHDKLDAI